MAAGLLLAVLPVAAGCGRPEPTALPALPGGAPVARMGPAVEAASWAACDPDLHRLLAYRYAPVHVQDVDSTNPRGDMLARVDFDGDWVMTNNWESLSALRQNPVPAVYSSVVSTDTHWYLLYAFFHPQDWDDTFTRNEHENDLEGALVVVARDGTALGRLEAAVTVAHEDFYSYVTADSRLSAGLEDVDGTLHTHHGHPVTFQEAKGHGLHAFGNGRTLDGDAITYLPSLPFLGVESARAPATPTPAPDDAASVGYYRLLDVHAPDGLWARRDDPAVFTPAGAFHGDTGGGCGAGAPTCSRDAAHAPWAFFDRDDATRVQGLLATDPAALVALYFHSSVPLSRRYVCNPYVPTTDEVAVRDRAAH